MGRSTVAAQLRSSSWRHYLFYLRHWPWVVGAVLLAVAPFVLLAALKTTVPLKHQHVCHFRSRLLWSGSPLATLQSFVCNLHNTCHQEGEDDLVDHYPGAPINAFLNSSVWWGGDGGGVAELLTNLPTSLDRLAQVAQLLTNPTLVNLMESGLQVRDVLRSPAELSVELTTVHHLQPQLVSAILGATLNVSRILSLVGYRDLKGVVCSPEQLSQFLVTWERSQVDNISATLCQLPLDQAANITRVFTDSLDPGPLLAKVSEVLEAIGGYEAEQVVRQVGSLLASLGRLEALAPLASTLNTLSTALRPLTAAINTLTASAWDHDSLSKLLSLVQSLSTSSSSASSSNTSASSTNTSSTNTSALHAVHSAMLLLSPYNLSLLAAEEEPGDQWAAVLRMAGSSVGAVGKGIGWAAGEVQRHPATHTLLTLATTLLPTLLQPTTLTPHRLGEALDDTKARLLPEVSQPITNMLTILHPAVTITTTVTEVAHILVRRVLSGPQLPPALALMVLTHTNHSLIQAVIRGERPDVWACERASWPGVSGDDWLLLEAKLCGEAGVRDLQGLAALHQSLVTQIRSQDVVNASQVVRSIVRLSEVIQSSADLLNLFPQDGAHNSSEGSRVRKKRSIVEGVDALLPQLPPGNHQEIQKLQQDLEFFKDVVNNLTVVMVKMTREMVREDQGCGDHLHQALLNTTTTTIHSLAGVTSTVVEMLVRLATVFQQPWKLSDVIHNTHVKSLLYLLPVTVLEVAENVYDLLEQPRVKLPPPLPQLVEVLNASYSVLSNINSGGDLWWWCAGGCPIMASLVQPAAALVLPRLLALPYLMTTRPLAWHQTVAGLMKQTSSGSWSQYPCGNVTLVDLFPPASAVADLPASWSHLEEIKHKVLDLEYLACHNATDIVEELLASSTQLSGSVKALMEDFTPGHVEVGAALQLMRSFGHLLASFNLSRILDGITTPQGTSIQQEFQDAFVITGEVKQQLYASMVLEVVDEVLEWMVGYEDARPLAHTLQYTMYHAHALATTLSALLQDGEVTLTSVWGLPEDYPLLQVFRQGPAGTATFILHQVSSFVTTALLEREVLWSWAERACNQSVGVSVMVEVVCYYAQHPQQPPQFQSNLTTALVRALTEYQKPEIKVPQIRLAELYDQCRILVGQLQQFDFNKSLNVSELQQFWDETIIEMRVLLAGLADLQKQWPWLVVDALVDRSQDLLQVLTKSYTFLTWLHERLLQVNPGNLTESIPSYIINFHSIINSTWIDLLDGLDYNLLLNSSFINLTLPEFCSSASSLEEPPASNGQFQKAVGAVCDQLSQFTPVNLNMWLQYEQMINDLNNKTLTFSSFKFKSLVSGVVNQTNTLIHGFLNVQPANSVSASDLSSASYSLTLPSYLLEENWNILLRRIGKRYQDSSLKSVEPAIKMVLEWLGVDQNHLDTFLKFSAFQIFNLKSFQAHNLQELLVDSPALWQLAETVIQYLPAALKDVITTASGRPHVVAELLSSPQKLDDWSSMCGFDFQEVGDDFHTFVTRLCQVIPEELIQEIRVLIKLDILQSSVNITVEDIINSSIAVSAQLIQQVEDGSFIQKIYRPLEYLGAQNWTLLANMIFNVTAEDMFDNSTMIFATLLEPLVELSRESTNNGVVIKAALQSLDKYLRWGRLLLALSRGGDIWMGIKEAYVDKPVVSRFLDIVENLPEFVWEYINFFGNSTVVANDILLHQDTPCNLHLFLLDGHRDLLGYNASSILTEVLEYVCEEQQMSLLMTQLLPDSSPVIANVTMDVDAAMLALLMDYIGWDIVYIIQGDYFEGDLQVPPWMDGQKWEKVLYKFTNFSVSVKEMIAASTGFGLLDTVRKYQGDLNITPGASLVYNLATRLTNSIDGLTGNFNACVLVEGLGPVEDLCHLAAPRIPDLVALILWFPESEMYYSLASGISPSVVYKEMCKAGVNTTLLHPGLNEEDWGALQEMFCSYKLQYANVMPLFNTSQIMTGLSIDWMKVFSSLDNLMGRLNIMSVEQFEKPLVDNPFMTELRNLTTVQKFVRGVFIGVSAFQQWSLSNENTSFKHIFAQILITANAALAPITKLGVPSLYERLLDPQLFKGLLKDYSHVVQDIQKKEAEMSLQYRLYLGSSLLEEMEHKEIASASQETTKNTTHAHLLSELRTTILNLTRSLIPPDMSSEMAMAGSDFVMTVFSNLVQNVEGALSVVKTPACYYVLSGEEFISTLQHVSTYVDVVQKHVEQWQSYVNLTCEVPESNLTQVVMKLLHHFGWEEDIKQMINNNDGTQQSFTCEFVFDQSAYISEKVKDLVSYYLQDEVAEKHLSSCLIAAVNSTVGVQFRGILKAAGDLFGLASSKNIGEALSAATTSLPGASSALRTLGSRVAVLVPFEDILVKHYETTLNFTTKVIDIIRNDLMVDVNRIYGADSSRLAGLLSTVEKMKKWIRIRNKAKDTGSVFKRSVQDMPIEILYQAAQDMGHYSFAENLLANVNYTYLLSEIENMRMQAILSSDWLDPVLIHMNFAVTSLSELSKLGAVMDLNKIVTGDVDPVTFLTGSVQLLQMKLWTDLALSFGGILGEAVPVITGSELGDDLQRVVDGIGTLQAAKNLGIVDFTMPTTALISNWTEMQQYLKNVLMMDSEVIEALKNSELNLMALLSLEDVTLEEVICGESQVERVVTLPQDTQVTFATLSKYLCNSSDSQGLAATFLQHLDLAPLIVTLVKYGLNSSLSSHGMTLEQVTEAVNILVESSSMLPSLTSSFSALSDLMNVLKEHDASEKMVKNDTHTVLKAISSPAFLERAGHALCGQPLLLVPDSLGVLLENHKENVLQHDPYNKNICDALYNNIRSLPGGGVLLHYIKPLMMGKIFYTPYNNITQGIIAYANETFEMVEKQVGTLKLLQESTRQLVSVSTRYSGLQKLQSSLQMPWVQGFMQQVFPASLVTSVGEQLKDASPKLQEASKFAKEFSDVIELGVNLVSCMDLQRFIPVNNEEKLLKKARHTAKKKEFLAGIVFAGVGETGDTGGNLPHNLTYTIRVDSEKSPSTFYLKPRFWNPGPYADMALDMKYHQGFIQLQDVMERAIIKFQYVNDNPSHSLKATPMNNFDHQKQSPGVSELSKAIEAPSLESGRRKRQASAVLTEEEENMLLSLPIYTKQQPYPCYNKDDFTKMLNLSPMMSLLFSLITFIIFVVFLIRQLVQESESRNRQLQEVMGLRLWLDRLVWLFFSLVFLLVIVLLVALIDKFGGLQANINFGILFTFLFCYGLSIISFCYLVSCLVPSTVLATFVGLMGLLVFNVPYISISVIQAKIPFSIIILTSLLPSTAFGFGFRVICQYELLQESLDYKNLWIEPVRDSDMTLGLAITMLLVDSGIFIILSVIISSLKKDGPQHLSTSGKSDVNPKPTSLKRSNEFTVNIFQEDAVHILDLDPGLKQSLKKGLSVVGLRRIFEHRGRSKVAVDNLNLELYEGQVLVLLGHNGAGKTTIISMLTRELIPTAGSIQVYGHDIHSAWDKARRLMGLCPQQSVLFPFMTVQEVLHYYAILKDSASNEEQTDINTVLLNMALFNHRDYLVSRLSEGMRRRLCMAIAFIGNSKLVILDEPTSGIDPTARNAIWEIISNNRAGRTILLTTHHLDEAETLADRVAILNQGRLLCVGSPLSLKSEHGIGYTLTLSNTSLYEEIPLTKAKNTLYWGVPTWKIKCHHPLM
nr:uncharacterized protein LOC123758342 [Procambarus clarkii]